MSDFSISSRATNSLQTAYRQSQKKIQISMKQLASGERLCEVGQNPAMLGYSDRISNSIRSSIVANQNISLNTNYLNNADAAVQNISEILLRMTQTAAGAAGCLNVEDLAAFDAEIQGMKQEITFLCRNTNCYDKQVIGRENICSYDANSNQMKFWMPNAETRPKYINKSFASDATDSYGRLLQFDPASVRTMSRDGSSIYYFDSSASYALCRYDISSDRVSVSSDVYALGSTLFTDETGALFANDSGSLYKINPLGLTRLAAGITTINTGGDFSVYNNHAYYRDTATGSFVKTDLSQSSLVTTVLVDATDPTNAANLNSIFASTHSVASAGTYIAGKVSPNEIGVMDTTSGTMRLFQAPVGVIIDQIQISEEGDRVYYTDSVGHTINTVEIQQDRTLKDGGVLIQSYDNNSLTGLSVRGSSFSSIMHCYIGQESSNILSYTAADLRLYALGLASTRVDTPANAQSALQEVQEATNRLAANYVRIGCTMNSFERASESSENYIANMEQAYSTIRSTDIAQSVAESSMQELLNAVSISMLNQHKSLKERALLLFN